MGAVTPHREPSSGMLVSGSVGRGSVSNSLCSLLIYPGAPKGKPQGRQGTFSLLVALRSAEL